MTRSGNGKRKPQVSSIQQSSSASKNITRVVNSSTRRSPRRERER